MDNKDKKEIGKRFRAAIVAKFGKLVKGAEALGMSPQSLHNYCKGERIPGREMVDKLDLLGINSDYIMLKTDNINQLKKPELVSDKTKHYYSTEGNIARLVDENFALKDTIELLKKEVKRYREALEEINTKKAREVLEGLPDI